MSVSVTHHHELRGIPGALRWRWLGAGLRWRRGLLASICKSILGGAVIGLKMNDLDISYRENLILQVNYFAGHMLPDRYFEIDRKEGRS